MELVIIIGLLALALAIITPILAFKANEKANRLEQQIQSLRQEVYQLKVAQREITAPPEPLNKKQSKAENDHIQSQQKHNIEHDPVIQTACIEENAEPEQPSVVEKEQVYKPKVTLASLETPANLWFDKWLDHMRTNWLVWIGGLAMVIGAGYLVQFVGSNFTFPPIARVLAATAVSLVLVAIGEWAHRKISAISTTFLNDKADAYIPAALYASGMSGLYATAIFSTVVYQFFSPTVALASMALLALACLALSARLGPLMAALGIFGGYTAPFWIGGSEPNYLLLSSYVLTISFAGLCTQFYCRIRWLTTAVSVAHGLWLLNIAFFIPIDQLITWFLLFIPISTYLLVFVPTMGWRLKLRSKHTVKWPFFHPAIPAMLLSIISSITLERSLSLTTGYLTVLVFPMLLLLLPSLRGTLTLRVFYPVTILAIFLAVISSITIAHDTLTGEGWVALAIFSLVIWARTFSQYLLGDKHPISYWMSVASLPTILILMLLYVNHNFIPYRDYWSLFSVMSLSACLFANYKFRLLITEASISLHLLLITLSYCYLDAKMLPIAMAVQILVAATQIKTDVCSPGVLSIKVMMAILVFKLSLMPFVPELQLTLFAEWSWILLSVLPIVALLAGARHLIQQIDDDFAEWFNAAILHVIVLLIFAQTNYWLLGSFNFLEEVNFYSVSIFTCQALALFSIYQIKSKLATRLALFYQYYSYILLGISALLVFALNTAYQPLMNTYVTGSDWPVFNWLAIGWVIPALILIITSRQKWVTYPIQPMHLYFASAGLLAIWVIYSIRQFWQDGSMMLNQPTSMAEMFSYSFAVIVIGAATTYISVGKQNPVLQKVGFGTLGVAVCKVFLLDTAALEGIWRALSFLGLGASLIALGWLFQRLNYHSKIKTESNGHKAITD